MFPLISIIQVENLSSFSKNSPAFLNYTIIDELLNQKYIFDLKFLISMDSTNIIEILATLFRQLLLRLPTFYLIPISKINKTPDAGCCKRPSSSHLTASLAGLRA
jgi:hypothetical protein